MTDQRSDLIDAGGQWKNRDRSGTEYTATKVNVAALCDAFPSLREAFRDLGDTVTILAFPKRADAHPQAPAFSLKVKPPEPAHQTTVNQPASNEGEDDDLPF